MNFTIDCDNIKICPTTENFSSLLEFQMSVKTKCCENPTMVTYYKPQAQNITLDLKYWIGTLVPGANQCEGYYNTNYWLDLVGLNPLMIDTITSTTRQYLGASLTGTVVNTYCIYNVPTGQQIYEEPGYDKESNTVIITLIDGTIITLNYDILYQGAECTLDTSGVPFANSMAIALSNITFSYNTSGTSENTFTLDGSGCIVIPKTLGTGFHTIVVLIDEIYTEYCTFLDCDDFNCKVVNTIVENIRKYTTTKNKDYLDKSLDISIKYDLLINSIYADCLDCCEKCEIFDYLNLQLNECSQC